MAAAAPAVPYLAGCVPRRRCRCSPPTSPPRPARTFLAAEIAGGNTCNGGYLFSKNAIKLIKRMLHYYNQFFTTCTILNWQPLLAEDKYKDILIESFRYLVKEGSVEIYSFVIMPNHFHIVWQIIEPNELSQIQHRLLKFTAQTMKRELALSNPRFLRRFKVDKCDRIYQIWKRKALSKAIYTTKFWQQKVNYIHQNPCRSKPILSQSAADYKYSSASYFKTGVKNWDFLANFPG